MVSTGSNKMVRIYGWCRTNLQALTIKTGALNKLCSEDNATNEFPRKYMEA